MKKLHVWGICMAFLLALTTACGAQEKAAESSNTYEAVTQQVQAEGESWEDRESPAEDANSSSENTESLPAGEGSSSEKDSNDKLPVYGEYYYDLVNVVLYLEVYDELPANYITKKEAKKLGWEGGSVEKYKEGAAIGGDVFGNREGLLPEAQGRSYTECDIDTNGYNSRGSRRLVFSNDGLYFYTSNHYENFSEVTVTEDYEVEW